MTFHDPYLRDADDETKQEQVDAATWRGFWIGSIITTVIWIFIEGMNV